MVRHFPPFVVPAEDCKEDFTNEMEEATVFCLSGSDRDKGGAVVFKKGPEELALLKQIVSKLKGKPYMLNC